MQHEGNFNPREYPAALDDLCGKELAFKVKMQAKAKVANVISYRDDPEIIQHLKDQFMEQLEVVLYGIPYYPPVIYIIYNHNNTIK
jgi:hypothetical protein